jgi:serine/threonine-protein phosphatase 2A regulatory subunit B''
MPAPFSYKDFYVIYCKFWELDRDRDMQLTLADLELYGRRALSRAALSRVIECYGVRSPDDVQPPGLISGHLGFKEFVNFILSVEEKTTDSALHYWYRILDLDEDGVLSFLELETFWEHQQGRLAEQYRIDDFFSLM